MNAQKPHVKRSRMGLAIVALCVLVLGFIFLAVLVGSLAGTEEESAGWKEALGYGDKVGVIRIEGTIMKSDTVLKQLRKFRKKASVKAIVLRINSPGGAVAPAQEIYREIERVREKKPVVASIETIGTSAAFYIASRTDRVVCSKGTITGSVGVIMMLTDLHQLIEKIGVNVNVIKAGRLKDIGSGLRSLTDEERTILEGFAKDIHEQFIADVAAGRKGKIDEERLRSLADGRFFTGEKALEFGLVDTIGNFYDAVKIAADLGGIKTEPKLIFPEKKWDSYLDMLLESCTDAVVRTMQRLSVNQTAPTVR